MMSFVVKIDEKKQEVYEEKGGTRHIKCNNFKKHKRMLMKNRIKSEDERKLSDNFNLHYIEYTCILFIIRHSFRNNLILSNL